MREIIENEKRSFIIEGLIKRITINTTEKPIHTRLGSTDRKGYTLQITMQYLDEHSKAFVDVQPYEEMNTEIVKRMEEEAKYKFANELYKKLYQH
jgi:hypothetical protein